MRFVGLVTKKLLKKLLCVHCSHPKVNNHGLQKKKKVENIDMNAGKHKTRFPNAHLGYAKSKKKKKKKLKVKIESRKN